VADLDEFRARLVALRSELVPAVGPGPYAAHTDGACIGNPGRGGWGALVEGEREWELWGPLSSTTNNRAEALGVLGALEWVPAGAEITVYADSRITLGVLSGAYKARANPDIWQEIRRVRDDKALQVTGQWVPGHAGVPGNERADWLSRLGATNGDTVAAERLARRAPTVPPELAGLVGRDDWERNFLQSVANQLHAGRTLSTKQQAIVDRIRSRGLPT
jgi:ribonuclease HI